MLSLSRKIGNLKVSWFLDGGTSIRTSPAVQSKRGLVGEIA